ncbi:MAG TPA: hypothetical protein VII81_03265 [Terriglobales bacterium]
MRKLTLLLLLISPTVFAQEAKVAQGKADVSKMHDTLPDKEFTAKTTDVSFTAPNGERVQRLEIVIAGVSAKQVWDMVSTSQGLRAFVAPVTDVEMKYNGKYYTNYQPGSKIGDPGTIYNTVLAYIPMEMVAIHVKLGKVVFPASVADADRLNAILAIKDLGDNRVRVSETMVGWQTGEDWDKVYTFFQTGNAYTLGQLYKALTIGPRQWKSQ